MPTTQTINHIAVDKNSPPESRDTDKQQIVEHVVCDQSWFNYSLYQLSNPVDYFVSQILQYMQIVLNTCKHHMQQCVWLFKPCLCAGARVPAAQLLGHPGPGPALLSGRRSALPEEKQPRVHLQQDFLGHRGSGGCSHYFTLLLTVLFSFKLTWAEVGELWVPAFVLSLSSCFTNLAGSTFSLKYLRKWR